MNVIIRHDAIRQGLSKYFTGKECKSGHVAERWTHNGVCLDCARVSMQRFHRNNNSPLVVVIHEIMKHRRDELDAYVEALRVADGMSPHPGDARVRHNRAWRTMEKISPTKHPAVPMPVIGVQAPIINDAWRTEHTEGGALKYNEDGTMSDEAIEEALQEPVPPPVAMPSKVRPIRPHHQTRLATPEEQALIDLQAAIDASVSNG